MRALFVSNNFISLDEEAIQVSNLEKNNTETRKVKICHQTPELPEI